MRKYALPPVVYEISHLQCMSMKVTFVDMSELAAHCHLQ